MAHNPSRPGQPRVAAEVTIERLAHGGAGVARHEGRVLFVPGGLPGDRVRVEVVARRARHLEGRLVELIEPSAARVDPPCPYAGRCGGCCWLALDPAAQRAARVRVLRDALVRIGRIDVPAEIPVVSAADPDPTARPDLGYRCRIEVALGPPGGGGARPVGFRAAASRDVVDVARCAVAAPPLDRALGTLRRAAAGGLLPPPVVEVELLVGDDPERVVATVRLGRPLPPRAAARLARRLGASWPDLAGLRIEPAGGAAEAETAVQEWGEPRVWLSVPGPGGDLLPLEVPAGVFTQANPAVNRRLVEAVVGTLAPAPGRRYLDLFCGAGNFALPLAAGGAEVLGLERDGRAVEAARRSAARLGLAGARFRQVDVAEGLAWLAGAAARGAGAPRAAGPPRRACGSPGARPGGGKPPRAAGAPSAGPAGQLPGAHWAGAVLDPPRAGAGAAVVDRLATLAPEVVAYVSCEPTTLARDLARLAAAGYRLDRLVLFDMFPQTAHLEALACLSRRA